MRLTPSTTEATALTLARATSPEAYPIRRMQKEMGDMIASSWIIAVLAEADMMCGAKTPPNVLAMFGRMALQQFAHRSVESLVIAIRDGMTSGKIYGALTYPQIAEWLNAHEAQVMAGVESEMARHRFTGDNLGADYLDRLERGDDRDRLKAHIADLKRKLANRDE